MSKSVRGQSYDLGFDDASAVSSKHISCYVAPYCCDAFPSLRTTTIAVKTSSVAKRRSDSFVTSTEARRVTHPYVKSDTVGTRSADQKGSDEPPPFGRLPLSVSAFYMSTDTLGLQSLVPSFSWLQYCPRA